MGTGERTLTEWSSGLVEWTNGDTAYLSVPFTWDLQNAYQRAIWYRASGLYVKAGGPAVSLIPNFLAPVASCGGDFPDAVARHNPNATFTSRGCPRSCAFCAVPKIEAALRELDDWPVRPIVCDNNLLACSRAHFDKVIDHLKGLQGVDFNQGLDARLLTNHHASRLAELDCTVRLAWDHVSYGNAFMTAFEKLRKAGIPKKRIRVYVLIGWKDTPEDAWFRLRTVKALGVKPNPMRFNPLDAMERDKYVGLNWTDRLLTQYMRYWQNLRFTEAVPFEEWLDREAP